MRPNLVKRKYITVRENEHKASLKSTIASHLPAFTMEQILKMIDEGSVYIGKNRILDPETKVPGGATITLFSEAGHQDKKTALTDLPIVYEDKYLVAVNKPSGIPSDETRSSRINTVPYLLSQRFQRSEYIQSVHRLDTGTSGILVLSKKPSATKSLNAQFKDRRVEKVYHAVVLGRVLVSHGRIESNLIRDPSDKRKYTSSADSGKPAVTLYETERVSATSSLVRVKILTGRTHQIRVHFSEAGHPVLGDWLYGNRKSATRLMLHATSLTFYHPYSGALMTLEAPVPDAFLI